MKQVLLIPLFIFTTLLTFAQGTISGLVNDEQGLPIPGAAVYLAATKAATVTNADGKFKFEKMPAGNYDVLVQMVGFKPVSTRIQLNVATIEITVTLTELTVGIESVTILLPAKKKEYLSLFMDYFIGRTDNSSQCTLKNAEALMYNMDSGKKLLTISSNEFLEVENRGLGYLIRFYLKKFTYNYETKIVYYEGLPNFEDLPGNPRTLNKWTAARLKAYEGSSMHFYRSLINRTTDKDGFIIKKNIMAKPISMSVNGLKVNMSNELVPRTETILPDTLLHRIADSTPYLNFSSELFIIYTKDKEIAPYTYSGYALNRHIDLGNYQISKIGSIVLPVFISPFGTLEDPASVLYSGYWAYEKIADQLPMDYIPIPKASLKN